MPKQNKLISSSISIWVPLQVSKQLSVQLTKPVPEVKPRLSLAQAWEGRRGQHCPSIRCRVRDQKQRKHSPGTAGRSKNAPKALRCKKKLGTGPGGSVEHPICVASQTTAKRLCAQNLTIRLLAVMVSDGVRLLHQVGHSSGKAHVKPPWRRGAPGGEGRGTRRPVGTVPTHGGTRGYGGGG